MSDQLNRSAPSPLPNTAESSRFLRGDLAATSQQELKVGLVDLQGLGHSASAKSTPSPRQMRCNTASRQELFCDAKVGNREDPWLSYGDRETTSPLTIAPPMLTMVC